MNTKKRLWTVLTLIFYSGDWAHAATDECIGSQKMLTEIGIPDPVGKVLKSNSLNDQIFPLRTGQARYFRALISFRNGGTKKWNLTIRDAKMRALETFSNADTGQGTSRWTRRLDAQLTTYFDLKGDLPLEVEIRQVVIMPETAKNPYYSLQGSVENFSAIETVNSGQRILGDFVGLVMSNWSGSSWCCSGVTVGENLFLTNWHCGGDPEKLSENDFWNQDVCTNTIIDMSWDGDSLDREFVCKSVVKKDKEKDYALLQITPRHGVDSLRVPLIRKMPVENNEEIVVVHHPACKPKQMSYSCNVKIVPFTSWQSAKLTDFAHSCDTMGGSSGGAVFDLSNNLVGLHHLPFRKVNGVCDKLNKGVQIKEIEPDISEILEAAK